MSLSPHDHSPPHSHRSRISAWFWSLTPACKEVARLTSESRERPLPIGTRLRLGLHRTFCKWCARYARQLDLIHEAAQLYPENQDRLRKPTLDDDAKARMKRALQAANRGEA